MLTISLSRLEFDGRHGATAIERRATRKFEVDVELDVDASAAEQSDKLADTIDYSKVAEIIVGIGVGEPHHMLESLARRMVDNVRGALSRGEARAPGAAQAEPADLPRPSGLRRSPDQGLRRRRRGCAPRWRRRRCGRWRRRGR